LVARAAAVGLTPDDSPSSHALTAGTLQGATRTRGSAANSEACLHGARPTTPPTCASTACTCAALPASRAVQLQSILLIFALCVSKPGPCPGPCQY
jgi:hypothetical protein